MSSSSSSSSSSGSIISSMGSVREELRSIRRSSSQLDKQVKLKRGFFDFARKSLSSNSSPIKQKLVSAVNSDHASGGLICEDLVVGQDHSSEKDDDDFDTRSLGFDPFVEPVNAEIPIANSTILSASKIGHKKEIKSHQTKSVRFQDWEKCLDDNQLKVLKSKLKQFRKSKQPVVRSVKAISLPVPLTEAKDRASSSEYSATPDITDISEIHDQSNTLTANQKLYMLPNSGTGKMSHLRRSEFYTPLTDLTKTPKLVKSSTEPIVTASTDESSVFSKTETLTESSARADEESQQHVVTPKLKAWRKFHASQKPKTENSQNYTYHVDAEDRTPSISQKFKFLTSKDPDIKHLLENAPSEKPFSLRLHKVTKLENKKPQSEGSNEESYDQVDILEQSPPQLPDISYPNSTGVFEKLNSTQEIITIPHVQNIRELQPGFDETCNIKLSKEIQNEINQIIVTLSHSSNTSVVIDDGEVKANERFVAKIKHIQNLSKTCDQLVDNLKIHIIKYNKQINDHENVIQDKESLIKTLQKKLKGSVEELETLRLDCSRYESRIASQSNSLLFERQTNEGHEKELFNLKKLLSQGEKDLEEKELYIENFTRLVRNHCLEDLDVLDEKKTLEVLRDLLFNLDQLKGVSKSHDKLENSLKDEIATLNEGLSSLKNDNKELKKTLKASNEQSEIYKNLIEKKDKLLQDLKLENENYINLLKSLECSYSELKDQLENEKFRSKESEAKVQELEIDKSIQSRKTHEMDKVLKDQLSLVNDVQNELNEQTSTIGKLINDKEDLKKENSQLASYGETYKNEITRLQSDLEYSKLQIEKLDKSNEESERRFNRIIRGKDEDISNFKRRISDLELAEDNLASELKDTRAKLSGKLSQCSGFEKKVGTLTKSLKDSNENNRVLRSEILRNNGLRQELKRTLVGLSIGIIRDLDGIIDNDSLSTVREDLKKETDDRELEILHDVSLFIEEAVGLIIKEYWSLNKRLSESQKGSLSNNSLGALQQIIEGQNDRLKQFQAKLHYYEGIFKKINRVNSGILVKSKPLTSTTKSDDTKRVRLQVNRDSDDSTDTVRTIRTNIPREKRENEITRLLSKVKDTEIAISEPSD